MTEYKLINPHIEGKFQKLYPGETAFDAAQGLWDNLSKNFTNHLPEFSFTMQRMQDNKMFHYRVNETIKEGDVNYTITELDMNLSAAKKKKFNEKLNDFQNKIQSGGKKHKKHHKRKTKLLDGEDESSSSSSSSSESEEYDVWMLNTHHLYDAPISYFWYYPDLYQNTYDYYFVPTFVTSPQMMIYSTF